MPTRPLLLLVEDEVLLAHVIADQFEEGGFEVVTAFTGTQATEELDRLSSAVAAVLTDIRMPGPIDGWAVGRHARKLRPDVPVIYASGDSRRSWEEHGVPNSHMLTKPFSIEGAIALVRRAVLSN